MKSMEMFSGGPVMPQIESARDGQVGGKSRILEVRDAGGTQARVGQLVVEPGRGPIAEVGADGLMNGMDDLQQAKDEADERQ
jgi:hypothetical protein